LFWKKLREQIAKRLPDFPINKIVLSATHTHTGPVMTEGLYEIPAKGVMQPTEYIDFFAELVAEAVVAGWNSRKPGKVSWGLSEAVIAQNRRTVYDDGTAAMYGATNRPGFYMIEGYEDHAVECLFFWDLEDKLIATSVNVACPAQEVEGGGGGAMSAAFGQQVEN